jgi:hypothetical protein
LPSLVLDLIMETVRAIAARAATTIAATTLAA